MTKRSFSILVAMTVLLLFVASCSAGGTVSTTAIPNVVATAAPVLTEAGPELQATVATAAECVGIDTQSLVTKGQTLYSDNCAGCHGEQGEGKGDFPPLAGSSVATANDAAALVQKYFSVDAHPKELTADDLSALFTFVRGSFGNTSTAVCPTDITIPVP